MQKIPGGTYYMWLHFAVLKPAYFSSYSGHRSLNSGKCVPYVRTYRCVNKLELLRVHHQIFY